MRPRSELPCRKGPERRSLSRCSERRGVGNGLQEEFSFDPGLEGGNQTVVRLKERCAGRNKDGLWTWYSSVACRNWSLVVTDTMRCELARSLFLVPQDAQILTLIASRTAETNSSCYRVHCENGVKRRLLPRSVLRQLLGRFTKLMSTKGCCEVGAPRQLAQTVRGKTWVGICYFCWQECSFTDIPEANTSYSSTLAGIHHRSSEFTSRHASFRGRRCIWPEHSPLLLRLMSADLAAECLVQTTPQGERCSHRYCGRRRDEQGSLSRTIADPLDKAVERAAAPFQHALHSVALHLHVSRATIHKRLG